MERVDAVNPTIALLTDFGTTDAYVGTMKGVIAGICPEARIIDLGHELPPQDLRAGAYALWSSYRYFPDGTIFCAVVDPGVGSTRRAVGVNLRTPRRRTMQVIAPDNGLLTPVVAECEIEAVHALDDVRWHLDGVSTTFHGRDIFAPTSAHLAAGTPLQALGSPVAPDTLVRMDWPEPKRTAKGWSGTVLYVDRFGNLITNIDAARLAGGHWQIELDGVSIEGVSRTFADAKAGAPVAYIGSSGLLELAVRNGNATLEWRAAPGDAVNAIRAGQR